MTTSTNPSNDPAAPAVDAPEAEAARRRRLDPVAVMALAVLAARVAALVWVGLDVTPSYDEGAYFSASALLARGLVPYRDFVAAHPPGLFVLMAPFTWVGAPSSALVACRLAAAVLGALTAWLVGTTTRRLASTPAALGAMAVYLVLPDVAASERQVLVEPVLNLMCVLTVFVWLAPDPEDRWRTRTVRSGICLALAGLCKSWAVLLVVPMALSATPGRRWRELRRVGLSALGVAVALLTPVLVLAGRPFFDQTIAFQARGPSHDLGVVHRLQMILGVSSDPAFARAIPAFAVVLVAVVLAAWTRVWHPLTRFGVTWFATIVVAFTVARTYIVQYNAHLGPAVALAAGGAIQTALACDWGWWRRVSPAWKATGGASVVVVVVAVLAVAGRGVRWLPGDRSGGETAATERLAELVSDDALVPPGGCIFSFEPGWLVVGDRLPNPRRAGRIASEPIVGPLSVVVRHGDGSLEDRIRIVRKVTRQAVDRCDVVILDWKGRAEVGQGWLEERFSPVATTTADGPEIWARPGGTEDP